MERQKIKSTLETSTNIAVLLVAIAALSTLVITVFVKSQSPSLRSGLYKGRILGQVPKVDYQLNGKTLLIALNTECSYCRESLPFYRKLVDANRSNNKLHIVAVFPNRAEEVARYMKENDLGLESVAEVSFAPLMISGTPSIILINKDGTVTDFWIGKLQDSEADKVIQFLTSLKGTNLGRT